METKAAPLLWTRCCSWTKRKKEEPSLASLGRGSYVCSSIRRFLSNDSAPSGMWEEGLSHFKGLPAFKVINMTSLQCPAVQRLAERAGLPVSQLCNNLWGSESREHLWWWWHTEQTPAVLQWHWAGKHQWPLKWIYAEWMVSSKVTSKGNL